MLSNFSLWDFKGENAGFDLSLYGVHLAIHSRHAIFLTFEFGIDLPIKKGN
jgi:hypothetical protein